MKIFTNNKGFETYIKAQKAKNKSIGFAPTMGALHLGHLSLCTKARIENDVVVVSIFVNPTQFNNAEDLNTYPRNIEGDLEMLQNSALVDAVYLPAVEDLYPNAVESSPYEFGGIENEMEGAFRPGHFDGVATVVEKLFSQVQPDRAYFGEKDYQQLAIINKLTELKNIHVNIIGVPIYREKNGLAMSSRNARLTAAERGAAKIIFETLQKVDAWFRILSVAEINKRVTEIFLMQKGMKLEYFKIAEERTLKETDFFYKDKSYRAFIVVFVGEVRLIDNMHLS